MSFKTFFGILLTFSLIGALSAGYVYFATSKKREQLQRQLALIQEHVARQEFEEALTRVRPIIGLLKQSADAAQFSAQYMQILQGAGRGAEARDEARAIIASFPGSAQAVEAHLLLGALALSADEDADAAGEHYRAVLAGAPAQPQALKARAGLALLDARRGLRQQAREKLTALLETDALDAETRRQIEDTLGAINLECILARAPQPDDITYKIEKGDTLDVIARRHGLMPEVLIQCNNIQNPRRVPVGTRIKIPNVAFSLRVDKFTNELTLLNHGKFFKKYRVRTGRYADETPTGEFKIINKKEFPRWTDPNTGKVYEPNDPENELGTRWLAFQGSMLGIHGTIRPETIGQYASNGCVGMRMADVEELYDLVLEGTPLEVVGVQNPELKERDAQ